MLTKNFKLENEFGQTYTGGAFVSTKDGRHAYGLNDSKVVLIDVNTAKVMGSIGEEGEDFLNIALSPNQQFLAVSNKNYMVKVFKLPDITEDDFVWNVSIVQQFKSPAQLCLELCFDPSSRFLAVGTSDSQIKVYDI